MIGISFTNTEKPLILVDGSKGRDVTPLKIAPVKIKQNGKDQYLAVNGGFLEVRKEKVVILAESAEFASQIDVERAAAAMERAEQRIAGKSQDNVDFNRAQASLQRAVNRINVSKLK